jgi:hypothetical protein
MRKAVLGGCAVTLAGAQSKEECIKVKRRILIIEGKRNTVHSRYVVSQRGARKTFQKAELLQVGGRVMYLVRFLRGPVLLVLALCLLRPFIIQQLQPQKPLVNFEHHYISDVFSPEALRSLQQLVESRGVFKTTVDDQTSLVEHIGEAVPVGHPDCDHPLMVHGGKNHSLCLLPARVDVGRHHLMYGGRYGAKESYPRLVSRMLSFITYIFDHLDTPVIRELFSSPKYVKLATEVCRGHSVFDPFQLNLILVLPGQELPMHWDVPWFWGATRFTIPQWLLVVMEQSGLFADLSVPQIQGVSWLHNSSALAGTGGEFFYYPNGVSGEQMAVQSLYNHAIIVDGCRVAHGTRRWRVV